MIPFFSVATVLMIIIYLWPKNGPLSKKGHNRETLPAVSYRITWLQVYTELRPSTQDAECIDWTERLWQI